jgi:hypothetical protein
MVTFEQQGATDLYNFRTYAGRGQKPGFDRRSLVAKPTIFCITLVSLRKS